MKRAHNLIDQYLHHRQLRGDLAESSVGVIRTVLRQWARHIGYERPRTWTLDQVAAWVRDPMLRPNTQKSRLTKLRPWCQWLVLEGHLDRDPTLGVGRVRIPSGDPRDLTADEVRRLIAVCPDERARLIVLVMAHMGLRSGDVARIRVEDIDERRRLLHVRAKGGRGEPTYWEPIPAEAWRAIDTWCRARSRRSGPLIDSYQRPGRALKPATIGDLVGGWLSDAGLKDVPWDGRSAHALRHSCAQQLVDAGVDLRVVQSVLGHATIRSTELYVRREPPGVRDALEGRSFLGEAA